MADKGQKPNKEKRKPKQDKKEKPKSDYKRRYEERQSDFVGE